MRYVVGPENLIDTYYKNKFTEKAKKPHVFFLKKGPSIFRLVEDEYNFLYNERIDTTHFFSASMSEDGLVQTCLLMY